MNASTQLEMEIQQRLEEFSAAWDRHDVGALADFFTEDGDLINPWFKLARGKAAIASLFALEHSGVMKDSTNFMEISHLERLAPDLVIVDCHGQIAGIRDDAGAEMPEKSFRVTFTMAREYGQWLISAARPILCPEEQPGAAAEYDIAEYGGEG